VERELDCSSCSIVLEPAARRLSVNQRALDLTTTEYEILACLLQHAGRVVSRETLMTAVFGRAFHPLDRVVDVHVSHLRKKLGCHRALIVTVRNIGYLLRLVLMAFAITATPALAEQGVQSEKGSEKGSDPFLNGQTEDIEPRAVGGTGVTSIGLSGSIDKFTSSQDVFPWQVTLHVDITHFVSDRFAIRGGLIGSSSFGDDQDDDTSATGPGAPSLQAHGGLAYYFTPHAMASFYAGGEYRAQLTDRAEGDAGTVLGKGGLQAAISSRVGVFVEGGYGVRLTRGADDEQQTRLVGELGVRIKF
jgi:DNA-binding winged helix-turn-helix (wHTH) protein